MAAGKTGAAEDCRHHLGYALKLTGYCYREVVWGGPESSWRPGDPAVSRHEIGKSPVVSLRRIHRLGKASSRPTAKGKTVEGTLIPNL